MESANDNNLPAKIEVPAPLFTYSKQVKEFYSQMCEWLIEDGVFFKRDFLKVSLLCDTLDLYIKLRKKLKNPDDYILKYDKGGSNINGYFTLRKQLRQELNEILPDLAIGMKSREKIEAYVNMQLNLFATENQVKDPWADHLENKPKLGKVIEI